MTIFFCMIASIPLIPYNDIVKKYTDISWLDQRYIFIK